MTWRLPQVFQRSLESLAAEFLAPPKGLAVDFTAPAGAPALLHPQSISWRVMKNPVALIIGGVAAVILELAEPCVRAGVWDHTSFRTDPVARMKRTGYAAMATIYAPADTARALIAKVNAAHANISGVLPDGRHYAATDPRLLRWVHATAAFGFVEAYRRFVRPLSPNAIDQFYAESRPVGMLYGAENPPDSENALGGCFADMHANLQQSDTIFEFIEITRDAAILPSRSLQQLLIRAAVELLPPQIREHLGLGREYALQPFTSSIVRALGRAADEIPIESAPPAQACVRLGLPSDYLYRRSASPLVPLAENLA